MEHLFFYSNLTHCQNPEYNKMPIRHLSYSGYKTSKKYFNIVFTAFFLFYLFLHKVTSRRVFNLFYHDMVLAVSYWEL